MDLHYDNAAVRRQDRLLPEQRAREIVLRGEYGFLAMAGAEGYGIPLNYATEGNRIYFHCSTEGEKIRRIKKDGHACFCIVGNTAPQPALFTTEYESVTIFGDIAIVSEDAERMHALDLLIEKYASQYVETGRAYAEKSFRRTAVLRLVISRTSGKCKKIVPTPIEK